MLDVLFQTVERQQQQQKEGNWGTVLDAGTGKHSLQWLLALRKRSDVFISKIVAITGEESLAIHLKSEFASDLQPQDEILFGNWTEDSLLKGYAFNVIIADYLIGAIDGFAPFFQANIIPRLTRHLLPNGLLHIIGMEPLPNASEVYEELVHDTVNVRDACIKLAGHRCYREYPKEWVVRECERIQLQILQSISFPIRYRPTVLHRQLAVARRKLPFFQSADVAKSMESYIQELEERATNAGTFVYGSDYVVSVLNQE